MICFIQASLNAAFQEDEIHPKQMDEKDLEAMIDFIMGN